MSQATVAQKITTLEKLKNKYYTKIKFNEYLLQINATFPVAF